MRENEEERGGGVQKDVEKINRWIEKDVHGYRYGVSVAFAFHFFLGSSPRHGCVSV
jgi:hypothetical protein